HEAGDLVEQGAERAVAGLAVAEIGEFVLDEGVVEDDDVGERGIGHAHAGRVPEGAAGAKGEKQRPEARGGLFAFRYSLLAPASAPPRFIAIVRPWTAQPWINWRRTPRSRRRRSRVRRVASRSGRR